LRGARARHVRARRGRNGNRRSRRVRRPGGAGRRRGVPDGRHHRPRGTGGVTHPASVLIVGAGLAGARCAETLRAEGYDGTITLVGEEPVAPYERPALSKEFLSGERTAGELLLRRPTFWTERGIELVLGDGSRRPRRGRAEPSSLPPARAPAATPSAARA